MLIIQSAAPLPQRSPSKVHKPEKLWHLSIFEKDSKLQPYRRSDASYCKGIAKISGERYTLFSIAISHSYCKAASSQLNS